MEKKAITDFGEAGLTVFGDRQPGIPAVIFFKSEMSSSLGLPIRWLLPSLKNKHRALSKIHFRIQLNQKRLRK